MSVFLVWRAVFFALLVLLNGTICASASLNIITTAPGAFRSLDIFLIILSAGSLVFLFPVVLIEVLRRSAASSKIWFECAWLAVLWLLNISAAAVTVSLSPTIVCPASGLACSTDQLLLAITWITALLVQGQFLLMMIMSVVYRRRYSDVWTASVKEFQWFRGGGTAKSTVLGSGPPTPTFANNLVPRLERMAERWQPEPARPVQPARQMNYARDEPQPLTYANAPELPPSRAPTHYKATASSAVGGLPATRKPSKRVPPTAPALYPQSVQVAMNGSPERAILPPAPSRSPPIVLNTQGHNITIVAMESPPIKNWPRQNPQEPIRSKKSAATPAPTVPAQAPIRSSLDSDFAPRPFGPRGPRRRPAPLDLTTALPGAKRK